MNAHSYWYYLGCEIGAALRWVGTIAVLILVLTTATGMVLGLFWLVQRWMGTGALLTAIVLSVLLARAWVRKHHEDAHG